MTLCSMVVSRDWLEVSVLECILGGLQMDVAVENEPQRALARLSRSKIDALIVDCDLNGSSQFLRALQNTETRTTPLVIMGSPHCQHRLDETGALFAFEKPISVEQAVRTLSAARNLILDGRLRYHRTGLEVPVSLSCKGRKAMDAYLVNVSQGGMQIRTQDRVESAKALQVSFELPGARTSVKAKAEIAWQDKRGNLGIRFVKLAKQQQRTLQLWLAQQYFAN
jgi:PilZ domain-containing protein